MTEQEATRASRDHWEHNKSLNLKDDFADIHIGGGACALCIWANTEKIKDDFTRFTKCNYCLLWGKVYMECCPEYMVCARLYNMPGGITQSEWEDACQALIDRLDSLLEKP